MRDPMVLRDAPVWLSSQATVRGTFFRRFLPSLGVTRARVALLFLCGLNISCIVLMFAM